MKKITSKKKLVLYACSGLGVNMLNIIVGSYLCSALLVGGFEKHVENWTYLNKDLVIAGLWATLILIAKLVDGIIDLPLSHFADNLKSKFGKRKSGLLLGFIPMVIAYVLFLVPLKQEASLLNTVWFAGLLMIFYAFYTLTMITYYATFAEITEKQEDVVLLSNTKSVCDVVYFSLSFALVPVFVSLGINIRFVALIFLPLALTMLIPFFLLKEKDTAQTENTLSAPRATLLRSLSFTFKDKAYIGWLCILFVMNIGLQLFLSGINEFFSTMGLNMTFIMASCFVPVPLTILLYNKIILKKGLGFSYRYILLVFSIAMSLMAICNIIPDQFKFPYAILCSVIASFSIGSFFSVTYTVPSQCAANRLDGGETASSMYFAIQGLFEGASAGLASGVVLVFLKQYQGGALVPFLTLIVALCCMAAFFLSFLLPKSISMIGKKV